MDSVLEKCLNSQTLVRFLRVKDLGDDQLLFDEAAEQAGLTEQQIQQRKSNYYQVATLSFFVMAPVLIYGFYQLLIRGAIFFAALTFLLTLILGYTGLKNHFAYTQLLHRRRLLTLMEWWELNRREIP